MSWKGEPGLPGTPGSGPFDVVEKARCPQCGTWFRDFPGVYGNKPSEALATIQTRCEEMEELLSFVGDMFEQQRPIDLYQDSAFIRDLRNALHSEAPKLRWALACKHGLPNIVICPECDTHSKTPTTEEGS